MLDAAAGIDPENVVEAHGSFSRASCSRPECGARADMPRFWEAIGSDKVPLCEECGAVVRPDVVFFGQPLPPRFSECRGRDGKEADLLIVLGTSLVVYPFASMAKEVDLLTPRLLMNRTRSGPFQ